MEPPENQLVHIGCDVPLRGQHAGTDSGYRDQHDQRPIDQKEDSDYGSMPLRLHFQDHNECDEVARGKPVQHAVARTELRQVKQQEVSLSNRSEAEHDNRPSGGMQQQAAIRRTLDPPLGHGNGDRRPHNEHEQRPDDIFEMQSFPRNVVELLEKPIEERALDDLAQASQNPGTPRNPQHVEPTQGIKRNQSVGARR